MQSEIINKILLDYSLYGEEALTEMTKDLPLKIIRWLASTHPDNRTRKMLFRLSNIDIGKDSVININFIVSDDYHRLLKIGDRVAISPNVTIICCSAPNNSLLNEHPYVKTSLIIEKEVIIENDVWVGSNVVILPGVTIGQNAIIGAGSVVTKSVEPFSIYAGAPAKKIRNLN